MRQRGKKGFGLFGILLIFGVILVLLGVYVHLRIQKRSVSESGPEINALTARIPTPTAKPGQPTVPYYSPVSALIASPASGTSPLAVSLKVPQTILDKMQGCKYSFGFYGASGNGLTVDWGDGKFDPQYSDALSGKSCTSVVQSHTYITAGTYVVKVTSWHPGPTDGPINDWQGTTTVKVTAQ